MALVPCRTLAVPDGGKGHEEGNESRGIEQQHLESAQQQDHVVTDALELRVG